MVSLEVSKRCFEEFLGALFCLEIPEVAKAKNLKVKLQGVSKKYVSVFSEIARWQLTEVKKVFYSMQFHSILGFTYIYLAMAKSTNKNNTMKGCTNFFLEFFLLKLELSKFSVKIWLETRDKHVKQLNLFPK